jgi:hypothetical protein
MRELDSGGGALVVNERDDALERVRLVVVPDAHVLRRDPPVRRNGGSLGEHERGAANRAAREVHEMPVVGESVDGRVLAHGRHRDTISQRQVTNFQLVE